MVVSSASTQQTHRTQNIYLPVTGGTDYGRPLSFQLAQQFARGTLLGLENTCFVYMGAFENRFGF